MVLRRSFLLLAVALQVYGQSNLPIVETVNGKIQGIMREESGETYLQFQGVPYANPPIGNRRFAPPERMTNWSGVWVANTTYTCIQVDHRDPPQEGVTKGEEDCLFLDIYVPGEKLNPGANFDVVVYIPGDTFMYGSSSEYATREPYKSKPIIFISMNYRVGIFGFLSLEDKVLPGNNGMRDQVMALQWIQENIKLFGGNPESVGLIGFGAGAASAHFHMMSPLSKGLFHTVLSVSGSALDPWTIYEEPKQKAEKVGRAVGCLHNGDSEAFLACLRLRTPHELIETTKLFREWLFYPFSPFALVVDNFAEKPFLPEHPYKLMKEKRVHNVPWMTCMLTSEGLYPFAQLMLREEYLGIMAKNLKKYLPLALDYHLTVSKDQMDEVTQKIIKEYLGDKPLDKSTFKDLVKMGTDRLYGVGMGESLRLQSQASKSPVYFVYYNYTSEKVPTMPEMRFGIKEKYGVAHGDSYLVYFSPMEHSKNDATMQAAMGDIHAHFAKTRTINRDDWSPIDGSSKKTNHVYLGPLGTAEIRNTEIFNNEEFWNSLPIMENKKLVDA